MVLIAPEMDAFVLRVTAVLEPYLTDLVLAGGVALFSSEGGVGTLGLACQ